MKNIFTEHPATVNESYLQHMIFAVRYAFQFGLLMIVALIHSIFPFLFTTYCSKKVARLNKWVNTRD